MKSVTEDSVLYLTKRMSMLSKTIQYYQRHLKNEVKKKKKVKHRSNTTFSVKEHQYYCARTKSHHQ